MSNMKKIIQSLQNINFTQYESKAYLALLKHDQVSGYELAKNSGIPASKIYQVLNKLLAKEVVVALDTEPVKYSPIPPDQVMSRFRNDYLQNIDTLKSSLDDVYNKHQHTDNYLWNITGREPILNRVNQFIDKANISIHLSVWDEEVEEIRDNLALADKRGIMLHIVHFGNIRLGFGN